MWLLVLTACWGDVVSVLPTGTWGLTGSDVLGVLDTQTGCRIGLWGPTWGTPGTVPVACVLEQEAEGTWIRLPFETGSSDGEASLKISLADKEAVLPLGVREGEHRQVLSVSEAAPSADELALAAAATAASIQAWRTAWEVGVFRVQSGEELVGEVGFRAGETARVGFYDSSWMTVGRVDAMPLEEGPDLVLVFDAEPSLDGQPSVLRINRSSNGAVVPLGLVPSPVEKTYRLVPGRVEPSERREAQALAVMASSRRELEVSLKLASALADAATAASLTGAGLACPAFSEMGSDWEALLVGYDVGIVQEGQGCGVSLEPTRVQHGRRLAAHVNAEGMVVESVLRGL